MPSPFHEPARRPWLKLAAAALAVAATAWVLWPPPRQRLVVYCAHDAVYAEQILREFERLSGIPVAVRYDSEATKSLGLVELLLRERRRPQCDVFWNNELLGTLQLAEEGLFAPYKGPGYTRIPAAFRDPDGRWCGFAARLRVWIVNTNALPATVEAVAGALQGDLARVAIAKPLYGTTRTHYTVLWKLWGPAGLQAWHRDWRSRGVQETGGNAMVKTLVAAGACGLGLTDTDDFFSARDEGKPVAALPVRLENGRTLCIPNTVAILAGTPRLESARELADYLLSAQTELALASSPSRQVPLGPVEADRLPPEVRELQAWSADAYDLAQLGPARAECLTWLKAEYLQSRDER